MKGYKVMPRFNPSFSKRELDDALGLEDSRRFYRIRRNVKVDYELKKWLELTMSEAIGYINVAFESEDPEEMKLAKDCAAQVIRQRVLNNASYAQYM